MKSLSELTGGRYRLELEESWHHERPEVRNPDRRWYEIIPCKGGAFIGLYAENPVIILQLWTPRVKNAWVIAQRLEKEPVFQADFLKGKLHTQKLDISTREAVLYFPAPLLPIVAEMAGARRRRQLSPEARERLAEQGRVALQKHRNANVESEKTAQERMM